MRPGPIQLTGAGVRTVAIVLGVVLLGAIAILFSGLINFGGAPVEPTQQTAEAVPPCLADDAIDAPTRTAANNAARAFYDKLLKTDATARDALSDDAKNLAPREAFDAMMRTIASNGPYSQLAVEHTYKPTIEGAPGVAGCVGNTVVVSALPGTNQIHTIFAAKTRNNDWALSAWMIEKDKTWRVNAFYVSMTSITGHTAADILRMGDQQATKGHTFNAYLLYAVARALADRGPNITQLNLMTDIKAALLKQEPPPELKGKMPFSWRLDGATFPVESVTLVGADNKLGLSLLHRDPSWDGKDTGKGERRNKRLIDGFVKAHPEYSEVFSYISVRILEPGKDSGWGTVFDATKGYDTGEPSLTKKKPK